MCSVIGRTFAWIFMIYEWNRQRLETLDFINNQLKQKRDARNTFDDVDTALDFYNQTHPDGEIILPPRPVLEDFL